ncbi:hypothetical protein [Hymenobacter metallilatus]|uniref:Uncharacterized protein n=1 Tax=Hymenobacter metallilatus TaxID=2493666 RepID=A0A3R9MJF4_9BACT|nr:hypothetical protein [Hymenobacter metallilatus]RSK33061.1 hypothetical protein EI290_10105 [Hymenobacter metallilatus]
MKQTPEPPAGEKLLFPPARTALRDLYRTARHLPSTDPYAPARLARIADQAEYFLLNWPLEAWPAALHSGQPLPSRQALLAWVLMAQRELRQIGTSSDTPWPYATWHRVSTLLLAALVPFA